MLNFTTSAPPSPHPASDPEQPITGLSLFGLFAVTCMVICYALGFLQGAWARGARWIFFMQSEEGGGAEEEGEEGGGVKLIYKTA